MNNQKRFRVMQINTIYPHGSTGKIAKGIHDVCQTEGVTCITACRYHEDKNQIPEDSIAVSSWWDCHIHNRLVKYTLLQGCFSYVRTAVFLRKVSAFNPSIIHLHNLHGSYINLPLLFRYIKTRNLPVVWTLHDCWPFTGQCPYFSIAKCDKWKTGCYHCSQSGGYLKNIVDNTRLMYKLKKKWFTGIERMMLVTPSEWLAGLVRQSFMKEYKSRIINNGLDLTIFKPMKSDFRQKYGIGDRLVILGVAFGWGYRKGLDVFCRLAEMLDERYQIVLVGTDEEVDKQLPANIISIHRTNNQQELAQIYSAADVFANPTREEMFGMVNIEALACGTPVITFETGGSPEAIDETCGVVVPCDDVDAMEREIRRVCEEKLFSKETCLVRAKCFDKNNKFREYVDLYEEMIKREVQ